MIRCLTVAVLVTLLLGILPGCGVEQAIRTTEKKTDDVDARLTTIEKKQEQSRKILAEIYARLLRIDGALEELENEIEEKAK